LTRSGRVDNAMQVIMEKVRTFLCYIRNAAQIVLTNGNKHTETKNSRYERYRGPIDHALFPAPL